MKAYLEPSEIDQIERAASNLRDRILVRLLFHLGCRISEVLSLKVENIDFTLGTVIIIHLKRRVKVTCTKCGTRLGISHVYCPRCGSEIDKEKIEELEQRRQRVLPLDQETLKMLREYVDRGGPVEKKGGTMIFGINRHRAWQIISGLALKAGLPKLVNPETGKFHHVSPHKLRDAFAVNAVKMDDSGDGLRLLQEHLGHQSFNTTARYRKVSGEEHREWYRKLWDKEKPDGASS
jgi:integrase/recombinase XerD